MRRDFELLEREVRAAALKCAVWGLSYIQENTCPVDTGALRNSGRVEGMTIRFGSAAVPYAYFVENGTRNMPPNRFVGRAIPAIGKDLERRLKAVVAR